MSKKLRVSEIFHSVQGEGNTMGKPSLFVRLQGCNLMCGGQGTEKDGKLHDGATWRCDTIEVWLKGEAHSPTELASELADNYAQHLKSGSQLVITGGEPVLQQNTLVPFVKSLTDEFNTPIRVECETNGTLIPDYPYASLITQFNVSPKLSNSGMPVDRRIKDEAMEYYSNLARINMSIFKFVITRKEDMDEIMKDFVDPFKIPARKIWLMPGCSDQKQFNEVAPMVAEVCQETGFQFSSRLQINLWNETTGV